MLDVSTRTPHHSFRPLVAHRAELVYKYLVRTTDSPHGVQFSTVQYNIFDHVNVEFYDHLCISAFVPERERNTPATHKTKQHNTHNIFSFILFSSSQRISFATPK